MKTFHTFSAALIAGVLWSISTTAIDLYRHHRACRVQDGCLRTVTLDVARTGGIGAIRAQCVEVTDYSIEFVAEVDMTASILTRSS